MSSLRGEERRLRRLFERALLAAAAGAAGGAGAFHLVSCGNDATDPDGDGSSVASGGETDAGIDGDAAADGPVDECTPVPMESPPVDDCGAYTHFACGLPSTVIPAAGPGCYLKPNDCSTYCFKLPFSCHAADNNCSEAGAIVPDDAGAVDLDCVTCPGAVGRVPAGLWRAPWRRSSRLGDYFARMAHLEAASVLAFRRLRDELAAHGAPSRMAAQAGRAARDEVRHARVTGNSARRHGARVPAPRVEPLAVRDLATVLAENAVEGCVRETFGALLATHQARHARDPRVARMMARIARDETRHAALSWRIARWGRGHTSESMQQAIARRQESALAELSRPDALEALLGRGPEREQLGLPDPDQRARLLDALRQLLA